MRHHPGECYGSEAMVTFDAGMGSRWSRRFWGGSRRVYNLYWFNIIGIIGGQLIWWNDWHEKGSAELSCLIDPCFGFLGFSWLSLSDLKPLRSSILDVCPPFGLQIVKYREISFGLSSEFVSLVWAPNAIFTHVFSPRFTHPHRDSIGIGADSNTWSPARGKPVLSGAKGSWDIGGASPKS